MNDKEKWDLLVEEAKKVLSPRTISPFINAGQVLSLIHI